MNYKGERERKLDELHSSWMQKCGTIISGMKENIHNYSLLRTGNKWKGCCGKGEKGEKWDKLAALHSRHRKIASAGGALARLASCVYDKAENKCTD